MESVWLNTNTSQLMSSNNAMFYQLQVPSLIPNGPLETYVSPRDEQDARTARAEVLWFKTAPLPPSKTASLPWLCSLNGSGASQGCKYSPAQQ